MKRLLRLLVHLYPSSWRQRYEAEFRALLEDVSPGWRIALDVLTEGAAMRVKMLAGWKIVAVAALLGLSGGLLASHEIRDEYASSAIIKIDRAAAFNGNARTFVTKVLSEEALAKIIERNDLYPDLRKEAPAIAIAEMRKNVKVEPAKFKGLAHSESGMVVQFSYYDRPLAQRVCSELVARIMDAAALGSADVTFELFTAPGLPNAPFYPNRLNLLVSGLFAGVITGLGVALVRQRLVQSV